jgi:acetylglutamate kinase
MEKYNGATVVVKYGGAAMKTDELKKSVMEDIVQLSLRGARIVLVHGGGPELSEMLARLGKETKFIGGLRYTDEETASIALMTLAGKVNKGLVRYIGAVGGRAVGLCGVDGLMLLSKKMETPDLGFVGEIISVDTALIEAALEIGCIPVIATVGVGTDGTLYNINADTAAGKISAALSASKLISVSDVKGILRDKSDEGSLIPEVSVDEIEELIESGVVEGGMIPKVRSCAQAVEDGVAEAAVIDGRVPHAVLSELLSGASTGTLIKNGL